MMQTHAESNSQICINSLVTDRYTGQFEKDSALPDAHEKVTVHVTVPGMINVNTIYFPSWHNMFIQGYSK